MSENNSFIDEVTEEVKRDRLFLFLKKYGWIGVILILGIVSGSIIKEITSSADMNKNRNSGDLLASLINEAPVADPIKINDTSSFEDFHPVVRHLLVAKNAEIVSDFDKSIQSYRLLLSETEIAKNIRDYAKFKLVLLLQPGSAEAQKLLSELIAPDNAFNLLALEQKILADIHNQNWSDVNSNLEIIMSDPSASEMLKYRANQIHRIIKTDKLN